METLQSQIPSSIQVSPSVTPSNQDLTLKPPKLCLLPFDDTNPLDWVSKPSKSSSFFVHYCIPHHQRLVHVAGYMTGNALGWYHWMFNNHLLSTWEAFKRALEVRLGTFAYDNHQHALFKLKQTIYVADYLPDFERLCNMVTVTPRFNI